MSIIQRPPIGFLLPKASPHKTAKDAKAVSKLLKRKS